MMLRLFPVLFLLLSMPAGAQDALGQKCSPSLKSAYHTWLEPGQRSKGTEQFMLLTLVVQDMSTFESWAMQCDLPVIARYPAANIIVLRDGEPHFFDTMLARTDLLFADFGYLNGREELPVPGHNLFANNIQYVHTRQPALDGSGSTISIKEFRFDSLDVDFKNRYLPTFKSAPFLTTHANIVASLAAGAGNSDLAGRGVARGSRLVSSSFVGLLPDDDADYAAFDISVQNHSYGLDIENYYGAGALAYDRSTGIHPHLLHVFSAGNLGDATPPAGLYANIAGFANLSGNFKMAKNVLTVGAIDSFGKVLPFSSRGPAFDGRVKPDLVAFGPDGTSGAAALVSGAATLVRQAFLEKYAYWPSSDLVRAILIGSARDAGSPGPDFISGYGNLNLKAAIELVQHQLTGVGEVADGEAVEFSVNVPPRVRRLAVTLCWNDTPAMPNAGTALVDDLDLSVRTPSGSLIFPWVLHTDANPDSLRLPAYTGRDSLNNVEQVALLHPAPGVYQVYVRGQRVPANLQAFALAFHWDTLQHFEWTCPVWNDPVGAGKEAVLRWESSYAAEKGRLEWKPVFVDQWYTVDSLVSLDAGWQRWLVPDTFAAAQVRMLVAGKVFVSDTFLIARPLRLQIGFHCPDSFMLRWAGLGQAAIYRIWGLGGRYLEPLRMSADTFLVLQKKEYPQQRYAVSAMLKSGNAESPASSAPDITAQGAGCYINTLFALLYNGTVELTLEMGTLYGVGRLYWEKERNGGWIILREEVPSDVQVFFADSEPVSGTNTYRVRLEMQNGGSIATDPVTVYYAGETGYWVMPNPVPPRQALTVLALGQADAPRFFLFDILGRLIVEKTLEDIRTDLALPALPPGMYAWMVADASGRRIAGGKVLASR
ncbi:MAG: S8 family serine peptidase [Saprospirales bacterium]|nr:S8 family serine peptidase [Saprospirales bacterium]